MKRRRDDAGITVVELVVGMAVMAVFMTIFSATLVTLFNASRKAEGVARTSQELSRSFAVLEKLVRYASYISNPAPDANDGGNWYVELQDTTQTPAQCTQLRLNIAAGQLQFRSWANGSTPGSWQYLANGVSGSQPFTLTLASNRVQAAQLGIAYAAKNTAGDASSATSVQLSALNTTVGTPFGGRCSGQRP